MSPASLEGGFAAGLGEKSIWMLGSLDKMLAATLLAGKRSRRAGFSFSHARSMSQMTDTGASVFRDMRLQCEYDTLYPAFKTADLQIYRTFKWKIPFQYFFALVSIYYWPHGHDWNALNFQNRAQLVNDIVKWRIQFFVHHSHNSLDPSLCCKRVHARPIGHPSEEGLGK